MPENNSQQPQRRTPSPAPGIPDPPEKQDSKLFRLFLVGVYLCCVSGLGMTLSIYYLFLWDSKMPELANIKRKH